MKPNVFYADCPTPLPSKCWHGQTDAERLARVQHAINALGTDINLLLVALTAKTDGQVIVRFHDPVAPGKRGTLLLDLEDSLKRTVDPGITVWLEAMGDRNSLRRLRGIEVKS